MNIKRKSITWFLVTIGFIIICICSCKADPRSEIVVAKDQEYVEEGSKSENKDHPNGNMWDERYAFFDGRLVFDIKANINIPKNQQFNLYRAIGRQYTQDEANHYINKLFGDEELYCSDTPTTKAELETQIIEIKHEIERLRNVEYAEEDNMSTPDDLERTLTDLEKMYAVAPEHVDNSSVDSTPFIDKDNAREIAVQTKAKFGEVCSLRIQNAKDSVYASFIDYQVLFDGAGYDAIFDVEKNDHEIGISKEKAIELANNTLHNMGITGYGCERIEIGQRGTDNRMCYLCTYSPDHNGVTESVTNISAVNNDMNYAPYDLIIVGVNNDGLVKFNWQGRGDYTEIMRGVDLLPFNTVKEKFKQYIKVVYAQYDSSNKLENELPQNSNDKIIMPPTVYVVNDIKLGYMRIREKDANDGYIVVPVWDFYGFNKYESGLESDDKSFLSLLTINAIDGSIIDRNIGY